MRQLLESSRPWWPLFVLIYAWIVLCGVLEVVA